MKNTVGKNVFLEPTMKKNYNEVELEIISIVAEDVITTSTHGYDPDGTLNGENDKWAW